jgi:hypothetical protein
MPLQHLLRTLTARASGDSIARLDAADRVLAGLKSLGAEVLSLGAMGREWEELRRGLPPGYFVHQFLPPAWKPLYVTDLRQAIAGIGLAPVGSATIRENVDAFTLDRPARELVAAAGDPDLRELLRDYLLMKRFRRDVFGRDVPALTEAETRQHIMEMRFMLPPVSNEAMEIPFNHPAAQAVLERLKTGPATLSDLVAAGHAVDALVTQVIALAAAVRIWPVAAEVDPTGIARINTALRRRVDTPDEIAFAVLDVGTAIALDPPALEKFRDGGGIGSNPDRGKA